MVATYLVLPLPTSRTTAGLLALRCSSRVMVPVTPGKFFVAAMASRTAVRIQRGGALHRVDRHLRRIVAQGGQRVRHPAERGLVVGDELLDAGVRVVGAVVVAEVVALHRRAAQLEQLLAVPAVAAHQLRGDAQLAGLPGDDPDVGVIPGDVDAVRLQPLDCGELASKVGAAFRVGLLADDLPAHLRELALEHVREPLAVVGPEVAQDGHLGELEVVVGEFRHHVALERVDEADPEDVVADLRHLGVRRGIGDHRHLRRLRRLGHGDGVGARHLAEDQQHLVLVDEPGGGVGRLLWLALVVVHPDVDLLALHPTGGVGLADRELDAVPGGDAEGGLRAGERADLTDEDGVSRHSAASPSRGRGRGPAGRRTGRRRRGRHLLLAADQGEGTAGQDCRHSGAHGDLVMSTGQAAVF